MNTEVKRNIQLAFNKINTAYNNLNIPESKQYYLTLGGINEVHLIKKGGCKSVFLGRLFQDSTSTVEREVTTIWTTLNKYFAALLEESKSVKTTSVEEIKTEETVIEKPVVKRTRKSKKEKVEEVLTTDTLKDEIKNTEDSEVTLTESEIEDEDAFSEWSDKIVF